MEKVVYQPVGIIKEVLVDKVVYTSIETREWESLDQFKEWLSKVSITSLLPNACVSITTNIQRVAASQGYSLSEALVREGYYYGIYIGNTGPGHDGLLVYIKGIYYYAEPLTGKIIKIAGGN